MSYCIAIVGRANVGKSSIFNVLYGHRVAIVDPTPGVTRDRVARDIPVSGGKTIELVDTGGVGMESAEELAADVDLQIDIAISKADLILFVVDSLAGLHVDDRTIARRLRASGKDIMLVANKADNVEARRKSMEFFELGLGEPVRTSAAHNVGIKDLKEAVRRRLDAYKGDAERQESHPVKLAFVGQRNVGKSTLINYLAGERRVVVSELAGTTRDCVDVLIDYSDGEKYKEFMAIDTAGVRRRKQLKESVDYYSQVRTHQAIQRADVVVHMIDAQRKIAKVDKQWGELILEHYKPTILAVNKMDLVPGGMETQFIDYIWSELKGMRFAPIIFISAKTGLNIFPMLDLAAVLYDQSGHRVKTSVLNEHMEEIVSRRPPPSRTNKRGKIFFATQVAARPPTIALFVNDSAEITDSYRRYIMNGLREVLPYSDVPVRLMVRRRRSGKNG